MKYAILILVFLCCLCGYLAYRLGYSNCRTDTAGMEIQTMQTEIKTDKEIVQRVMSVPDADNLLWLRENWLRAD